MPRYFLHVRGPGFYNEDTKGFEVPDEEAARRYAERIAEDLTGEPEYGLHTVVLATERGEEIMRIAILSDDSTRH